MHFSLLRKDNDVHAQLNRRSVSVIILFTDYMHIIIVIFIVVVIVAVIANTEPWNLIADKIYY